MIEFKADCGHTVRARNEDIGAVVRCSYCGRQSKVPDDNERDLEVLFREVQQEIPGVAPPARGPRKSWLGRRIRSEGEFNPFPVVVKLVYVTVLVSILVILYQKVVRPMLAEETPQPPSQVAEKKERRRGQEPVLDNQPKRSGNGLIAGVGGNLFVRSVPSGASVFCVESSKATTRGRINRIKGCQVLNADDGSSPGLSEGAYIIEMAFVISDPKLKAYQGYTEFRRAVDEASDAQRRDLMEHYFIPDDASEVFVAEQEDQLFLVRQYRDVEIRQGQPRAVRGLFLPRLTKPGKEGMSIEDLVVSCLGQESKAYAFDEGHVSGELAYYGVPDSDRRWVMDALQRIGVVPYVTPDRRTRLFRIGVVDGQFSQRVIREAKP